MLERVRHLVAMTDQGQLIYIYTSLIGCGGGNDIKDNVREQ